MAHIRRDGRNGTWFVGFRYDGREFYSLETAQRGTIEDLPGLPKPLVDLCSLLKKRGEVDATEVVAFPVKATAGKPAP